MIAWFYYLILKFIDSSHSFTATAGEVVNDQFSVNHGITSRTSSKWT